MNITTQSRPELAIEVWRQLFASFFSIWWAQRLQPTPILSSLLCFGMRCNYSTLQLSVDYVLFWYNSWLYVSFLRPFIPPVSPPHARTENCSSPAIFSQPLTGDGRHISTVPTRCAISWHRYPIYGDRHSITASWVVDRIGTCRWRQICCRQFSCKPVVSYR